MSTTSLMTFAEFEQLPDEPGKRELVDGELIEMPPPRLDHGWIAKRLYHLLHDSLPGSRVWYEAGYRIGGGWLQPDVSVSWPHQESLDGYFRAAPTVAIEILSPSNTAGTMERKISLYLGEGGAEVWIVDPRHKTMTVYRAADNQIVRIAVDSKYESQCLGLAVDLAAIFD